MTEPASTDVEPTEPDVSPTGDTAPAPDGAPDEPVSNTVEPAASPTGDTAAVSTMVDSEPDTFPRAYVEQLRQENASYRTRAGQADALAERLMAATVREAVAGILADPTDLTTTDALLDGDGMPDPERIAEAARELVGRKPHLGDRRPRGDVDQGARTTTTNVDLAGMLRART